MIRALKRLGGQWRERRKLSLDKRAFECLYHSYVYLQLSRLQVENSDLTPAHACGPISHAWLKNVSCCCLAWRNFQKFVYSDPFKERKPCSDVFRSLRTSSKDFGLLQESLEMIVSSSKISALPGYKSHAYILEKVGRYTLVTFYFEPFLTSRFPKQTYYVY